MIDSVPLKMWVEIRDCRINLHYYLQGDSGSNIWERITYINVMYHIQFCSSDLMAEPSRNFLVGAHLPTERKWIHSINNIRYVSGCRMLLLKLLAQCEYMFTCSVHSIVKKYHLLRCILINSRLRRTWILTKFHILTNSLGICMPQPTNYDEKFWYIGKFVKKAKYTQSQYQVRQWVP